jgi:hypothetical protein
MWALANDLLTSTTWSRMTESVGNNENLNDFGTTVNSTDRQTSNLPFL